MPEQIPLPDEASALRPALDAARAGKTHEVRADVAYRRLGIVNVVFVGPPGPGTGDGCWSTPASPGPGA